MMLNYIRILNVLLTDIARKNMIVLLERMCHALRTWATLIPLHNSEPTGVQYCTDFVWVLPRENAVIPHMSSSPKNTYQ